MIFIRILKCLFGIYAAIVFGVMLLVCFIEYLFVFLLFSKERSPHIAHKIISIPWAKMLSWLFFIPAKIKNKNFIDPKKTYVFIANHRSLIDIPIYALSNTNTLRFLAKAELTKIPMMGYIIKRLYLSVNRTDRADRNRSIEIMRKSLDEGISVFLCPEGTRNKEINPPLLDFRDGAFRLAILTKTPLAALTLLNSGEKLNSKRPLEFCPGAIYAIWDKPIETSEMTLADLPLLKEMVRTKMIAHLEEWRCKAH